MTRIVRYFQRTLSARISLWVLLSVTFLLVVALVVMFRYSHNAIEKESLAKAEQLLTKKVLTIENLLHRVEVATTNMRWNVENHLDDPDAMVGYAMQMVKNNPDIIGCAISFEPFTYPEKGELYTTYAFRAEPQSDEILMTHDPFIIQPNEYKDVPYLAVNWYFIPIKENTTCWVRPHAPNDTINSTIVTCCMPIHNQQGETVGVLASDISVEDVNNTILYPKPFPESYCAMLGVQGTYIVYPDSTYLYHKMVRMQVANEPENVKEMVESMLAGEDGIRSVNLFGKDSYVLYKGLNNKHWSACIVCPEKDIFNANRRYQVYMIVITILGVLLIFLFLLFFIRKQLIPLNMLADSAEQIANGHYSVPISSTHRVDEIGILQNNFGAMQTSLSRNIQQLSQMSEVLKERNEELGAIHAQVTEADNVKMNLIHKVADKMIMPIKEIESVVDKLEERRANLTKEDVHMMSEEMMSHTKVITDLLDQMLDIPKKKKKTS
ncbi:MAG: HAMP domain-containing protein [Bacteroidaceae bacterium]|nr:HAMP domain-containing protein [Bacteroidaceae bacterium]